MARSLPVLRCMEHVSETKGAAVRPAAPSWLPALLLGAGAIAVLGPLWPSLLLAAWIADFVQPMVRRFARGLGGRRRAAATMTILVIVLGLAPLAGALAVAASSAREIVGQLGPMIMQRRAITSLV